MNNHQILSKLYWTRRLLGVVLWSSLFLPLLAAAASESLAYAFTTEGIMLAVAGLLWWYRTRLLYRL